MDRHQSGSNFPWLLFEIAVFVPFLFESYLWIFWGFVVGYFGDMLGIFLGYVLDIYGICFDFF